MDKRIIKVNTSQPYDVIIGRDLLASVGELVAKIAPDAKIALITDDVVDGIYASRVEHSLVESGLEVVKYVFKHGEGSKNLQTYGDILSFLAVNQMTRTDLIVALGGGVVGDMAGFVAATYLRGIRYVQIPTTLLAQIDSSVGGKTAIDLEHGKNLVGAFLQPEVVICDVNTLSTLPQDIYLDGMGEGVKYALLDAKIYQLLSSDYQLEELVYLCVDYKRRIVEIDEKENGLRRVLNLGHTIAHGIEQLSNYTVSHGRAVAMGLEVIVRVSQKHGYIDEATATKLLDVIIKNIGNTACPYAIGDIAKASLNDKKRTGDSISLVLVDGIGSVTQVKVEVACLEDYLIC